MSYYENCAFPKPKNKKKEKLYNGYKDKASRICAVTGTNNAERHEIFGGANRQKSIKYKLQIDLSSEIHEKVTNPKTEEDLKLRQNFKEQGQKKFELMLMKQGQTALEARKTFMHEFGRNYLEPIGLEGY